jgi:hypothetical protein
MMTSIRCLPAFATLLLLVAMGMTPRAAGAQSAGTFAQSGFGARGFALGGAQAGDISGNASPYYNPALSIYAPGQNVEASAALLSLGREWNFLQFTTPLRPRAGIGIGLIRGAVGGIDGRDNSGYHTREYATEEMAFFLTFGTRIGDRAALGAAIQLFRGDLFDDVSAATSIGIDIGLTYRITPALTLGLVADDLLARYSWDTTPVYGRDGRTTSDRFPTRLRAGLGYAPEGARYRLLAEYESRVAAREFREREVRMTTGGPIEALVGDRLRLHDARARAGAEVDLGDMFTLRAGVDHLLVDGLRGSRPAAGFRIRQPVGNLVLEADYAGVMQPYGTGLMHMVTARVHL